MDTIFALATPRAKSGVAILRVSGSLAALSIETLCDWSPAGRETRLSTIKSPTGEVLDKGFVLFFEEGASFTGEAVAEFQIHGSLAVIRAVEDTLSAIPGLRPAEAGEFTRRALINNRMSLDEVEGLGDLISAETEAQRQQATRLMSGTLGAAVSEWRKDLIRARALLEATIDFADEEVPTDVTPEVTGLLDRLTSSFSREISGVSAARRITEGFVIAVVGPPNVGKSTLINAIAGREVALTSEIAGTTRDVIELRLDIGGFPVTFLDTAGVRFTEDSLEMLGVDRALNRAARADLRIFLTLNGENLGIEREPHDILCTPKGDENDGPFPISGLTGLGLDELIGKISDVLSDQAGTVGVATNDRHRLAIEAALRHIRAAQIEISRESCQTELASEELRAAAHGLDVLVGKIDVEHLLDDIFSSFCIGK